MQTELAQLISLTSFGNQFLKNEIISPTYFPDATVFRHCNTVDFRVQTPNSIENIVAKNPNVWFEILKRDNCKRLYLYYRSTGKDEFGPEYNLAGFVGGAGIWVMEAHYGSHSQYWEKQWKVTRRDAEDRRIWEVNYGRTDQKFTPTIQQLDITEVRTRYSNTLDRLIEFCVAQKLNNWLEIFDKSKAALSARNPREYYYDPNLLESKSSSLEKQQLLFSAANAWVFGGMMSWNDMGFDEQEVQATYLQLSDSLYEQIIQSFISAVNSD